MDSSKLILRNLKGKAKVERYWTKNMSGEKIQAEDISDDNGFYTTRLLSYKDMFANGKERRTSFYHAERKINPASSVHHNSTGHLKDL